MDIDEAYRQLRAAYNQGEPNGSVVRVNIHAKWERWCVRCEKRLTARSRFTVVDNTIVCHMCAAKGDERQ